jgi:homoserine dehydrogenase
MKSIQERSNFMPYKLAFIGFGTVGQGLADILLRKGDDLLERYGFQSSVVAISDINKGSLFNAAGLDLKKVLDLARSGGRIDADTGSSSGWDSLKTIELSGADVVVEVSYTDIKTGEPAISHVRTALQKGQHVVTSNKGPVALAGKELSRLANQHGVCFRYEGTVASGTPVLNLAMENLAGTDIKEVRGILNGTTNYILTQMEQGRGYEETLKKAQELGYAEAKPDADVEGWDALAKIVIIANMLLGGDLQVSQVPCKGITDITPQDMEAARKENSRWKLIARAWRQDGRVQAKVSPEKVSREDFLAGVGGVTNALTFDTDLLGQVTIVGPGAGRMETGFSLLVDLLAIHRKTAANR